MKHVHKINIRAIEYSDEQFNCVFPYCDNKASHIVILCGHTIFNCSEHEQQTREFARQTKSILTIGKPIIIRIYEAETEPIPHHAAVQS